MKRNQTLSMLLMLTASAGLAIAQPAKKSTDDQDVLRGPAVNSTTSTNVDRKPEAVEDLSDEQVSERLKENPIEMRELTGVIRRFAKDQLGLTREQNTQIKKILDTYREDLRAYQEENMDEIRVLRDRMRAEADAYRKKMQESEGGNRSKQMQNRAAFESESAKKLRKMLAEAPPTKTAMKQIRNVLSDEQEVVMNRAVLKMRASMEERREAGNENRRDGDNARRPARKGVDSDEMRPAQPRERNNQRKKDKPGEDD